MPTAVVTRHLPHENSIPPRFTGDLLNAAYASDLEELIAAGWPALWVHGHVHDSCDYLAEAVLRVAPPRFALAGLSMGGIVAMNILALAPERVERLALLDTNPLAETPEKRLARAPQIARALSGGLRQVIRDEMKPHYLAPATVAREAAVQPILDLCLDMALQLGPEVFKRQSLALRERADRTHALADFKRPALVLMGAHDTLCPRERHDLMHSLLGCSRLAVIARAGHLPPLEQPATTAAELAKWLVEPLQYG